MSRLGKKKGTQAEVHRIGGGGDETVIIDTPDKCREFIKSIRIGPRGANARRITFFKTEHGKQVSIDDATDAQVEQVATELANALNRASAH